MATVKMPEPSESVPCRFSIPWTGNCKKPTNNGWCDEHESLECVSCGEVAVKGCDATSSFVCEAPLCKTCTHTPFGDGHVTGEVAKGIYRERRAEEKATIASRTSSTQRVDEVSGLPLNLLELLKGDQVGYELVSIHSLELVHGLMGYFPAVFREGPKRIIVTTDVELLTEIWRALSSRKSKMLDTMGYVNAKLGICYPVLGESVSDREESKPIKLLTRAEFDELMATGESPFEWAPGLVGDDMSPAEFMRTIEVAAEKHDITLPARA